MLSVGGISPQVFECVKCRKKEELLWFSAKNGGCVCGSCADQIWSEWETEQTDSVARGEAFLPVSASTLYTMQYILATPIESLYTFTVTEEVLWELKRVLKQFLSVHIDRKFKSLEMLEEL